MGKEPVSHAAVQEKSAFKKNPGLQVVHLVVSFAEHSLQSYGQQSPLLLAMSLNSIQYWYIYVLKIYL